MPSDIPSLVQVTLRFELNLWDGEIDWVRAMPAIAAALLPLGLVAVSTTVEPRDDIIDGC